MTIVWQETSLERALQNAMGRTLVPGAEPAEFPSECWSGDCDTAVFADGCAIVVLSQWRGPYSELTPDIDARPPKVWWGYPT